MRFLVVTVAAPSFSALATFSQTSPHPEQHPSPSRPLPIFSRSRPILRMVASPTGTTRITSANCESRLDLAHPVVVLVHGGCWKAKYAMLRDLAPMGDEERWHRDLEHRI